MKKILIVSNIVFLCIVIFLLYKKYKKAPPKFIKQPCVYSIADIEHLFTQIKDSSTITLIGDSRVNQGNWQQLLGVNSIVNLGINGDRVYCICNRLNHIKNTKICFIGGGVMDLYTETPDSIINSFVTIVEFCKQKHIIPVIHSIVKIADKASPYYKQANLKIDTVNNLLSQYSQENSLDYIDLNTKFVDATSNTLSYKFTADGTHFNDTAYKIWANQIITILKRHQLK